jgi:hypothetical protein
LALLNMGTVLDSRSGAAGTVRLVATPTKTRLPTLKPIIKPIACGSVTFTELDGCTAASKYPNCIQKYKTVSVSCSPDTINSGCITCKGSGNCAAAGGYSDKCTVGWNSTSGYYCTVQRNCISCRSCK